MNLRFVEAFYWVASLKSISRAADKLFLTQSAMSSRIATLEEELGVLLLDRREKQFKLTTAGVRFLVYAQKLLELQREVKTEMGSDAPMAVSMRIGAIESVLHSWLIPWLEKLRRDQPGLELDLTVETTPILMDHIRHGALDLVFAAMPASAEGVRNRALPAMDMAFVGNPVLHKKRKYGLDELAEMELLTFQKGSQPHVTLLDLFRQHKLEPKRVHAISSISAMVQLVQGGFGVALLPNVAVQRLTGFASLKLLSCDAKLQALPIHASYRTDPTSQAVETVVKSAMAFVDGAMRAPKKGAKMHLKGKP
ncbi:LysR family transcriptional regulator [uncultured Rhodoferax sp.]|uniref:LysR family transcriptional regulator n=1 Tax=uncultured Rhodoferax sp. TaxID=223188 RepID=UPI0025FB9E14|nr:LysR family transcriptional regulator [uncultured Rhodoferax sp.]